MRYLFLFICLNFDIINTLATELSNNQLTTIKQIESYLNNINSLSANFIQISNQTDSIVEGKLYIQRPGKLRWQYELPDKLLIIINDKLITYFDYELEQVSYTSSEINLTDLLLEPKINLINNPKYKIIDVNMAANLITLSLLPNNNLEQKSINLVFEVAYLELKKIEIIDSNNQEISITLSNIQKNQNLPKHLFFIKNPNIFRK